ncbi:hypothetical protein NQZ68_040174 [Dissostichus eleginoides]|nr:hypothetical protein NQZ68_040174 [Dissostichus eleginoides]
MADADATFTIGTLEDTIYSGEPDVVNEWGDLYLPEIVRMKVLGVVERISDSWDQLVLMTCEDGKLYAYEGEELHLVASSLKQLREEGISYPGFKTYYEGQAFKDMTEEDWAKFWQSPTGRALELKHHKQVLEHKAKSMEYLKATAAIQKSRGKPPGQSVTSLGPNNAHLNQNQKRGQAPNKKSMKKDLVNMRCFRRNAEGLISKMLELNNSCQDEATQLVEEILHSIFFFGRISTPPFSPEMIVNDSEYLGALKDCYPWPFEFYSSQLPRRTPFSCLLDMVVFLIGQENEEEIKQKLREIISELGFNKGDPLVSSTICVSQNTENPNSEKYYGVSMSTSGRDPGRIMVAASCLPDSWHPLVAGAVMSFTPNKHKNKDFNGTLKLPQHVSSVAYSLHGGGATIPPCESCVYLFGLGGKCKGKYPHGNCAEVESLSKMLKKDKGVREQAGPTSEKNRDKAEKMYKTDLWNLLNIFNFPSNYQFYIPSDINIDKSD